MKRIIFATVIAVVAAVVIYFGGWELIKYLGDKVWPIVGPKAVVFGVFTIFLIFCTITIPYGIFRKICKP